MAEMIPVMRPELGDREAEAAAEVVRSGWLMTGPKTAAFEEAFAKRVQSPHACAVASCTAGLHLSLRALGVTRGDAVITVSHSYIATANAVRLAGAEPVFVDIDSRTYNMSPKALVELFETAFETRDGAMCFKEPERLAIGESPWVGCAGAVGRLAAILVPHQIGLPADLPAILPLAKEMGVPVLEDAACAIGAEVSMDRGNTWRPVGTPMGAAACFSFHPRKIITTGEGGMMTTADPNLDRAVRILRQHGMDRSTTERETSEGTEREQYLHTSTNYRMTDIQAAVGLVQLDRLEEIIARRRTMAARYGDALKTIGGIVPPFEPDYARTTFQSYVVRFPGKAGQVGTVAALLRTKGVDTRPGIMCAHREVPYREAWPEGLLPESEIAMDETLILPLYASMTECEQDQVLEALEEATRI